MSDGRDGDKKADDNQLKPAIRSHQRAPSGSRDFKEATKRDALQRLEVELEKLQANAPQARRPLMEKEFRGFKNLFRRFLAEQGPSVTWEKIEKLPEGAVIDYSLLTTPTTDNIHHMLDKLVVVKLNGGLGTSMGCKGPKSVIQVRNDLTFLDLTVQQIEIRSHQRAPSGSRDFKEATKRDALQRLEVELEKLQANAPQARRPLMEKEFRGFKNLFRRFLAEQGPSVTWEKIEKLPEGAVIDYSLLTTPTTDNIHHMLDKLVVVKLNGGLGTSMGCKGPKSVIQVRNDLTFLDLTVQQIEHLNKTYKCHVPLVLMNSFNTDEDTQRVIRKYANLKVDIHTFNQSCHPRINRESLLPVAKDADVHADIDAWYPPGHGDFYESFYNSGLLQKFIQEGRTYCFISNIDNLGATVDLNILNLLLNPENQTASEFVMEVTDKTRADVKGGTLIQYEDKLRLLEIAQVPKEHVDDFKSVSQFKFFNTNNLWAKLDAIQRVVDQGSLNMEIIVNNKTLSDGVNVIQLETAVGAAMKCFDRGVGVNVPRSRFLPVKKTSDLLLVMSNLYSLSHGSLVMSDQRMFPTTPLVKLGDNHFAIVKEYLNRFATIPDLIELDHLTVSGDVTFGRGVTLKGTVIIIANHGDRIDIPSGALLENKIVSGNLRILDH